MPAQVIYTRPSGSSSSSGAGPAKGSPHRGGGYAASSSHAHASSSGSSSHAHGHGHAHSHGVNLSQPLASIGFGPRGGSGLGSGSGGSGGAGGLSGSGSGGLSGGKPVRVDTLALRDALSGALGGVGSARAQAYWRALREFCAARLTREEFEQEAHRLLGAENVHLHNSLLLGLLYNASPGVPGPSSAAALQAQALQAAAVAALSANGLGGALGSGVGAGGAGKAGARKLDDAAALLHAGALDPRAPPRKRVRLLVAGLTKKERGRLKNLAKSGLRGLGAGAGAGTSAAAAASASAAAGASSADKHAAAALAATNAAAAAAAGGGLSSGSSDKGGGSGAALDWAGAGAAELLEKKRREDERRKAIDERKRFRAVHSAVGALDWKNDAVRRTNHADGARRRLPLSVQQSLSRGQATPRCIHTKQLPTVDALQDRMTLHAVESGLPNGVHPQAAAMVLTALQSHLQTLAGSALAKIRAPRGSSASASTASASAATGAGPSASNADASTMAAAGGAGAGTAEDDTSHPHRSTPGPMDLDAPNHQLHQHQPAGHPPQDASAANAPASASASAPLHARLAQARADGSPASRAAAAAAAGGDASYRSFVSGSTSTASTSMSMSFGGDTSAFSLASTAPTSASFAELPDPAGAAAGFDPDASTDAIVVSGSKDKAAAVPQTPPRASNVMLSDLAFLFASTPQSVVEPLGLNTTERLLAADTSGDDEEEVDRQTRTIAEATLARVARETATAKMPAAAPNAPPEVLASELVTSHARARFAIDQSAPLRILDRRTLAETQALEAAKAAGSKGGVVRPSVGGLSLAGSGAAAAAAAAANASAAASSSSGAAAATSADAPDAAAQADAKAAKSEDTPLALAAGAGAAGAPSKRKDSSKNAQLWEVVDPVALLSNI